MYFCHFNLFSSCALILEVLFLGPALALFYLSRLCPFLREDSRISWVPLSSIFLALKLEQRSHNCKDPLKRNLMILPMMALVQWLMSTAPVPPAFLGKVREKYLLLVIIMSLLAVIFPSLSLIFTSLGLPLSSILLVDPKQASPWLQHYYLQSLKSNTFSKFI